MRQNLSRATVLIIERRPTIANLIADALQPMPTVELLGCIASASERDLPNAAPDIVICGTGILTPQTLAQLPVLRAAWPRARLVALSFDPNHESQEAALRSGADAYVSGLHLVQELRSVIRSVLDSRYL